jgi:hypothetical protein
MLRILVSNRSWMLRTERGLVRLAMITVGFAFVVVGLAMGVSIILLPPGLVLALSGVGLFVWGAVGDLPLD